MSTELAVALAALAGAALGGLVTVWATHLANVNATERERKQRLHDYRAQRHAEAGQLLSEFFGVWSGIARRHLESQATVPAEEYNRVATLSTRISLLFPSLHVTVVEMIHFNNITLEADAVRLDERFTSQATTLLRELEPKE